MRLAAPAAAMADGISQPQKLWHALLFVTTGRAVQERLAEQGVSGYEPYVYRERLFARVAEVPRAAARRVRRSSLMRFRGT